MNKSLAQLKRDAKTGKYKYKMIYRYGQEIPERLQGIRTLVDSNSVSISFLNLNGEKSELNIRSAKLIDYTDDSIVVYGIGKRDLNDVEKKVMDEWEQICQTPEYQKQSEVDMYTDSSSTYWKKKFFFTNKKMEHLLGFELVNGKKYDFVSKQVFDCSCRGKKEIEYRLIK